MAERSSKRRWGLYAFLVAAGLAGVLFLLIPVLIVVFLELNPGDTTITPTNSAPAERERRPE